MQSSSCSRTNVAVFSVIFSTLQSLDIPTFNKSFKSQLSVYTYSGQKAEKRKAEAKSNPKAKGKATSKKAKTEPGEIKPEVKDENDPGVKAEGDEDQDMDEDLDGEEWDEDEWPMDGEDDEN